MQRVKSGQYSPAVRGGLTRGTQAPHFWINVQRCFFHKPIILILPSAHVWVVVKLMFDPNIWRLAISLSILSSGIVKRCNIPKWIELFSSSMALPWQSWWLLNVKVREGRLTKEAVLNYSPRLFVKKLSNHFRLKRMKHNTPSPCTLDASWSKKNSQPFWIT